MMAERRWQVSTYITDEKVYNDLKVYLMENNITMCAALMAGLKALLAGKIDLDGNVIAEKANEEPKNGVTLGNDEGKQTQQTPTEDTSAKDEMLDNKMQKAWQAVVDAQQAAHNATFGNVDRAIDEWLVALTDALGVVIEDSET